MTGFRKRQRQEMAGFSSDLLGETRTWDVWPPLTRRKVISTIRAYCGQDILRKNELCLDETHVPIDAPDYLRKGGPLDLTLVEVKNAFTRSLNVSSSSMVYQYVGRLRCNKIPTVAQLQRPVSHSNEVASYGTAAWNRFRPGRPAVNMGVFLGELRDLPRMLQDTCRRLKDIWQKMRSLKRNPRFLNYKYVFKHGGHELAQDYLSYQFGWAPFVGDLLRCYEVSKTIDRRFSEIRRNNGKLRRRGGRVVHESETVVLFNGPDSGAFTPVLPSPMYRTTPHRITTQTISKEYWFKGAFRYYIPDIGSLQWENRTRRKLYGLSLNAEVVWNLVPWTWLIDWFGNIGDVISSLDTGWADNLTCKYAYMMGTDSTVITHNCTADFALGGSVSLGTELRYISKQRVAATPYGFAVSYDSLSPRRLAILAALGISRLRGPGFFGS